MHGLNVVGVGSVTYEGGSGTSVIFENSEDEILAALRPEYGIGRYGIPNEGGPVTYHEGSIPLYIRLMGEKMTAGEYGFGKAAITCGAMD